MTEPSEEAEEYGSISLTGRAREALRISSLRASVDAGRRVSMSTRLIDALDAEANLRRVIDDMDEWLATNGTHPMDSASPDRAALACAQVMLRSMIVEAGIQHRERVCP